MEGSLTQFLSLHSIQSVEVKKTDVHEANGKNPSVKVDFMDVDSQEKNSTAL